MEKNCINDKTSGNQGNLPVSEMVNANLTVNINRTKIKAWKKTTGLPEYTSSQIGEVSY